MANIFSKSVDAAAFKAGNGEMAWRPSDLEKVFKELEQLGLVLLGGEAWLIQRGQIHGVLPLPSGPPGVFQWSCEPVQDENWSAFVSRSLSEARAAVLALDVESSAVLPPGGEIFYNLTWLSRDEL